MPDTRDPVAAEATDPGPLVAAPPPFVDRRVAFRRAADRLLHEETRLLARSIDRLAAKDDADARLGGILRLLAEALGAPRAALLGDRPVRRVAVVVDEDEDPEAADALAAWLDAAGPRTRAQRAAAGSAPVVRIVAPSVDAPPAAAPEDAAPGPHRLLLALPSDGGLLGFDLLAPLGEQELEARLPAPLLRHAAAILAVVSRDLALERELELLRAKEAERSRFVSTVAHELRTPLTGLGGYLDLILDDKVDDPAVEREFLERGRGIVSSIASLVGDLLELSRLDSGSLRLEVAPFSMAELGGRVTGALQPLAMDRGIALEADLPPRMRMALGDRRRIEQILTNLVGNALKFVAPGGRVQLAAWTDGPVALFAVRDDGAGIGPDDRARIFERFQRLAAHEGVTGTGLGLPIARDLARAMGGELDVASVPGSGSSFVVALPGPAGASPDEIEAVVEGVLPAEEQTLEERAVLRALELAGRDLPAPLRPVPPLEPVASADDDLASPIEVPARAARPAAARRRPRLRALDGGVGRAPSRPSPA
jgi:signal transduction histidine kinase